MVWEFDFAGPVAEEGSEFFLLSASSAAAARSSRLAFSGWKILVLTLASFYEKAAYFSRPRRTCAGRREGRESQSNERGRRELDSTRSMNEEGTNKLSLLDLDLRKIGSLTLELMEEVFEVL